MKTDSQLQRDVLDELAWEPSVDHAEIGVAVTDGVVTLSGIVQSYTEKIAAEKATRRVKGVKAIAEELTVRYDFQSKTADSEIAQRVSAVLSWDPLVPDDRIDVTVEQGVVKLTGEVDWNYQKQRAFKAASKISGVTGIANLVRIEQSVDTGDVKRRIEDAFKRQAHLESSKVNVVADGHKVRLGGRVNSWHERGIAERAAWSAPGVSQVEDNIIVG